jgi:hypothetical protein
MGSADALLEGECKRVRLPLSLSHLCPRVQIAPIGAGGQGTLL